MHRLIPGVLLRWARSLRFPTLFFVTAALFVADLLLPDMIPFVDELLLGLGTLLLANLRKRALPSRDQTARASEPEGPGDSGTPG